MFLEMISGNTFHPNVDEWLTHERGMVKSGSKLYVDFEYLQIDNTGRQALYFERREISKL